MMGEFIELADSIASAIEEAAHKYEERGLSVSELGDIIQRQHQRPMNVYPSITKGECQKLAVFISLSVKKYVGKRKKKGHLSFPEALIKIVQHMQGHCVDETYHVVLITDSWNSDLWSDWHANIDQIKHKAAIEVYLLESGNISRIKI